MKVYAVRNDVFVECGVPDGAVYLEVGSQDDGKGGRTTYISSIDWDRQVLTRGLAAIEEPFPARWYREDQCEWRPSDEGKASESDGWRGVWHARMKR